VKADVRNRDPGNRNLADARVRAPASIHVKPLVPHPEDPDLYNVGDYLMNQCTVYYDLWWSDCRTTEEWSLRPNQPVFTALNDCLIAKGHEQDEDSTVWDDSQEDRDRGWAMLVVCSPVVGG